MITIGESNGENIATDQIIPALSIKVPEFDADDI